MRLIGIILLLGLSHTLLGQKVLQIERFGRAKVKKFYIGDELNYRLAGDKAWYKGTIQDLIVEENIILFEDRYVRMGDIQALRKRQRWSRQIGNQLYVFAGSWLVFSTAGTLLGWELRWDTAIITGSALATGWLIKNIFKYKKYKMGKRRRLRMLNLNPIKPIYGP